MKPKRSGWAPNRRRSQGIACSRARSTHILPLMSFEGASQMNVWTLPLPGPTALLWPMCLARDLASRLTGKPNILNPPKFAELRAPCWVCAPTRRERETGCACATALKARISETLSWYRQHNWL
jgi:hypothetical protein